MLTGLATSPHYAYPEQSGVKACLNVMQLQRVTSYKVK